MPDDRPQATLSPLEPTTFANLGDAIDRGGDPAAPALIDLGGEAPPRSYSYAEFDALADAVARGLLARGLRPGERVAILSANRAEFWPRSSAPCARGWSRCRSTGSCRRRRRGFRSCAIAMRSWCCATRRAEGLCPADLPRLVFGGDFADLLDPGPFGAVVPAAREPAMFLYTSGSTGRPKGVVLSHHSHLWVIEMRRRASLRPLGSRSPVLVAAPLYHMNALAVSQSALAQHDTIILLPGFTAASYIEARGAIARRR